MRLLFSLLATTALVAIPHFAVAQLPASPNGDRSFVSVWPSFCQALAINSISALSGPEMQPILEAHPIDAKAVCQCIEARMKADKYLPVLFSENNAETLRNMESKPWRLYIRGKAASFTAACMASELERSVNAVYPGSGG